MPCWTDVTPYPFGSDGNPVDPTSPLCNMPGAVSGPGWTGDFGLNPNAGNPPCYLQVNSLAFRAWNRGLAATGQPGPPFPADNSVSVGFGVWLWNGTTWFPDPTFPGSGVCPGSVVLWAGKLDYWLIGSNQPSGVAETTLCRFDGVNLQWEPLSLPAATVARLTNPATGTLVGGITSGACYAWNSCWFFGVDGVKVHWDGQSLSDASAGLGTSPWLEGDFTGAVAGTDPSGHPFGLAVTRSTMTVGNSGGTSSAVALPPVPASSPPALVQLFGSQGGPWAPLTYPSDLTASPSTTDLTAVSADSQGDVWAAGDPDALVSASSPSPTAPAPLQRLTETGTEASCPGYDGASPFPLTRQGPNGYTWDGISTFPDGSALASAKYADSSTLWNDPAFNSPVPDLEPVLVHAVCGQPPATTAFRRADPLVPANQVGPPVIPADLRGYATAVAATAPNDAWAATSDGSWPYAPDGSGGVLQGFLAPHLYRWTDGQPPNAPAGDDNESRPSLFTLDPPVYQVGSPTIVVTGVTTTTTHTRGRTRTVKERPAIYAISKPTLRHSRGGTFTLVLTFKVRRPVTIGLEGIRKGKVVASTGLKRFTGHRGRLALELNRKRWPTRLRLVMPKTRKAKPA